jgi:hypothetical protein
VTAEEDGQKEDPIASKGRSIREHFDELDRARRIQEVPFYAAIGRCITQWALIDRSLFRLFKQGIGARIHVAGLVYYQSQGFSQRLRQIDALLNEMFSYSKANGLAPEWVNRFDRERIELRIAITDLLPVRNIIAHQPVRSTPKKDGQEYLEFGIIIEPYQRALGRQYKGMLGKKVLLLDDLVQHERSVAFWSRACVSSLPTWYVSGTYGRIFISNARPRHIDPSCAVCYLLVVDRS